MAVRKPQFDFLDKVNFIVYYAFNPCQAPFWLYVETAKGPTGDFVLWLLQFDLFDFAKQFFRPAGLRSRRHGRKGSRKDGKKGLLPDVSESYADKMPGRKDFAQRKYGSGTRWFYALSDVADRVTWPLALTDEVTNTVYDTLVGVMHVTKDGCPGIGRFMRSGSGGTYGGAGGYWHAFGLPILHYAVRCTSSGAFSVFLHDGKWTIFLGANVTAGKDEQEISLRLRCTTPGKEGEARDTREGLHDGETASLLADMTIEGPATIVFEIGTPSGFFTVQDKDVGGMYVQFG